MYDFYKVKGGKNHQEFRHPYFKRGHYKDLAYIRRKSVHKNQSNDADQNIEEQSDINDNMQEKLETVKNSLEIVTAQNKELIEANKEMIAKLYNFKGEYEVRLKKLFFIFMVLVHNYDEELLKVLKKSLEQLNIDLTELTNRTEGQDMSKFVETLCKRMVSQQIDNQKLLDQLIDSFFAYFEAKGSPIKKEIFILNDNALNTHNDNFSISLFNAETVDGFAEPRSTFPRSYKPLKSEHYKEEQKRPFLFREPTNQSLLQSPSKINEINFDEINMNEDAGNMLLERRDDDSFLMSGANSVLMLSPFKRNL